jgi:spore coat polysaccharide biosynthesis protein SpsF
MTIINNRRIVAVVQARMGSSRLPNKMMLHLHGYPVVEWIFRRVGAARLVDSCVFAIPDTARDDVLQLYLEGIGAKVFRGSEHDVVGRFHQAALLHGATHVVRVCADNPLICPQEIDNLISCYFDKECDYVYNHIPRNNRYPDGLGAEMVSANLLELIQREASSQAQREHVFNYLWDNSERFSIGTFDPLDQALARPELKLDLDTYEDYRKLLSRKIEIDMDAREIVTIFGGSCETC